MYFYTLFCPSDGLDSIFIGRFPSLIPGFLVFINRNPVAPPFLALIYRSSSIQMFLISSSSAFIIQLMLCAVSFCRLAARAMNQFSVSSVELFLACSMALSSLSLRSLSLKTYIQPFPKYGYSNILPSE